MKTVSLELAKLLHGAEFPQESYFYWTKTFSDKWKVRDIHAWDEITREGLLIHHDDTFKQRAEEGEGEEDLAAPSAEEILDRLPVHIKKGHNEYNLALFKQGAGGAQIWSLTYFLWGSSIYAHKYLHQTNAQYFLRENLAEAAGKMWLYLKENNLLKPNIGKTI